MSTIDWVMAQALGGHKVDSELYQLLANHEKKLRLKQNTLKTSCAKVDTLLTKLKGVSNTQLESNVECDDILIESETIVSYLARSIQRAEHAQEAFRLRHGLGREPISPKVAPNIMFLMILLFVEAGINASFFQNAYMVASPLAALLISLLISITNILVCTCAGYFIGRWKGYGLNAADANSPAFTHRRYQAIALFWCFIGVMIFFHATVGLVRALETLDNVQHTLINYEIMLTTPEAIFLVLTGGCLSIITYQKGKQAFADPYPEFGERYKAVTNLYDKVFDAFDDLIQQVEERFNAAIRMLKQTFKKQQRSTRKYNCNVEKCHLSGYHLEQAVGEAESQIHMQLSQVVSHHRAVSGYLMKNSDNEVNHLISFEKFLDFKLPEFYQPPNIEQKIVQLTKDKAEVINNLNIIFQRYIKTNLGESHEKTLTK